MLLKTQSPPPAELFSKGALQVAVWKAFSVAGDLCIIWYTKSTPFITLTWWKMDRNLKLVLTVSVLLGHTVSKLHWKNLNPFWIATIVLVLLVSTSATFATTTDFWKLMIEAHTFYIFLPIPTAENSEMKWFCQKSPFWRACELQPAALYTRPGEVSFKNSSQEAARTCIDISQAWINQILDSFHDLPKTCGVFHFPEPAGKTVCFWHKLIADDVSTNDCMFPDHVLFVPPLHLAAVKDSAPIFLRGAKWNVCRFKSQFSSIFKRILSFFSWGCHGSTSMLSRFSSYSVAATCHNYGWLPGNPHRQTGFSVLGPRFVAP